MKTQLIRPLCVVAFAAVSAFAQTAPNPLVDSERGIYNTVKNNIISAAEKMPEENYGFKPTPDVRSFGQLVGHVADAQYLFCSAVLGEKTNSPGVEKNKTSKADLVQALRTAFAYCDRAYTGLTDAQAAEKVKLFGRDMPQLSVLSFSTAHDDEHYGNMVTYLRLKSIVPPSSERRR